MILSFGRTLQLKLSLFSPCKWTRQLKDIWRVNNSYQNRSDKVNCAHTCFRMSCSLTSFWRSRLGLPCTFITSRVVRSTSRQKQINSDRRTVSALKQEANVRGGTGRCMVLIKLKKKENILRYQPCNEGATVILLQCCFCYSVAALAIVLLLLL